MKETEQKSSKASLEQAKLKHNLALVEAALYVTDRPLNWKRLGYLVKTRSKNKVKQLIEKLSEEYENRDSALEILQVKDDKFVLQLKSEYAPKVRRFAMKPKLSSGPLKTLSYIAYRQPILQKKVVKVRGSHVYSHIKELEERGLIVSERTGRTKRLRTTDYFADHFGFSHNVGAMKRQLKSLFEDLAKRKPEEIEEEEPSTESR
ncbi:MAG: SMC-Scp complex subunit ScpB [Thermoproteota archaeon]|nr:SMC-Scp complex subunit ScpB [Thermoproteota archaeon]